MKEKTTHQAYTPITKEGTGRRGFKSHFLQGDFTQISVTKNRIRGLTDFITNMDKGKIIFDDSSQCTKIFLPSLVIGVYHFCDFLFIYFISDF